MKQTSIKTATAKAPARQARWNDSGLSERYGKLGPAALSAALLYAGRSGAVKGGKPRH